MSERVQAKQSESLNWLEHRIGRRLGKLNGQSVVEFEHRWCVVKSRHHGFQKFPLPLLL